MLHRPYIRSEVRAEVEARAEKNEKGQFLDANTKQPIEGKYDLGHKAGHEFRTEQAKAEKEGLTQEQFNDKMNNPDLYQIEDPSSNRSHQFEAKEGSIEEETTKEETTEEKTTEEEAAEEETTEEKTTKEEATEEETTEEENAEESAEGEDDGEDGGEDSGQSP